MNTYEDISVSLNKKRRFRNYYLNIEMVSIREMLNMLDYLDSLDESLEYVEEVLVKELDFN